MNHKKRRPLELSVLFVSLLCSLGCSSRESVRGVVLNAKENKHPVPFADVAVLGTSRTDRANEKGEFLIKGVRPGIHQIRISNAQFKGVERQVEVRPGRNDTLEISLVPIPRVPSFQGIYSASLDTTSIEPADFTKYPRAAFGFRLSVNSSRNEINSFKGTITKELGGVAHPETTVTLAFTGKELDRIYRKALEIHLFELREPAPQVLSQRDAGDYSPSHIWLKVKAGTVEKHFDWDTNCYSAPDAEAEWQGLGEFLALIHLIVTSRPEYQALPMPQLRI